MPILFDVDVLNPRLSTHEGLGLRCRLRNQGEPVALLPGPFDRSGAFRIRLLDPAQNQLREMSRLSSQVYMDGGRVDSSLDLDTLGTGEQWDWEMDLASCHYTIPPGDFLIDAVYDYEPEAISLRAGPVPVRVAEDPLALVSSVHDNPILERLTLLIEAEAEDGPAYFLRYYSYDLPQAAWYSTRVLAGEQAEAPFLASAGYYQSREIDLGYQHWIVWRRGESVCARRYDDGEPSPDYRAAPLPEESTLIPSAFHTSDDQLYLFFWARSGRLECHRLEPDRLVEVFERATRARPGSLISIGADESAIHVATAWRGVFYECLDYTGRPIERLHLAPTRLQPVSLVYEPAERRIKGLFRDGPHGRTLRLVVADFENDALSECQIDRLPLRDDLLELSFDQDRKGRFHLLASTAGGRLYYWADGRGPILVAEGEIRYHPLVVAPLKVYLGCYRREYGYRFVQYQRRRQGSKFVGRELHP
ncbi:MAG: hypothetical protein AAB225_15805 [Acidobacteriota bacterium]